MKESLSLLKEYMPHGHCFLGDEYVYGTFIISNTVIFLSYSVIALVLLTIFFVRKDFRRIGIAAIYGAFIFLCGIGHLIMVLNVFKGYYLLEANWHLLTAGISFMAAIATIRLAPDLVAFPTNSLQHLEKLTENLTLIEDKFQSIFYLSPDLICVAGDDYTFKKVNPSWEKALGYSKEELTSRPYLDLVHPDDVTATKAAADGLVDVAVDGFRNRYRKKSGGYVTLEWSASQYNVGGETYAVARVVHGQ